MDTFNVSNFNLDNQPKKASLPKFIFIILGIAVVAELIYAGWSLLSNKSTSPLPLVQNTSASVPRISLTTPQQTVQVGSIVPVTIVMDTGNKTISGADLIIKYDPKVLEVTKNDLFAGKIFPEYPLLSVAPVQGLVAISGISSSTTGFTGSGEFARVNFKAKSSGKTNLVINFEKGSTTTSNLVEIGTSRNILEEATNLELLIQ